MRRHDLTKKISTYPPTYLPTYIPTHLPTYLPCDTIQSCRLVTIETLITIITIENLNSRQSLLPYNQEWHWTAFAILAMFICILLMYFTVFCVKFELFIVCCLLCSRHCQLSVINHPPRDFSLLSAQTIYFPHLYSLLITACPAYTAIIYSGNKCKAQMQASGFLPNYLSSNFFFFFSSNHFFIQIFPAGFRQGVMN